MATRVNTSVERSQKFLSMRSFGRSETGPWRQTNQDSGYFDANIMLVADGVGGAVAGDIASAGVVHTLVSLLHQLPIVTPVIFRSCLSKANHELGLLTEQEPKLRGMSTTLAGVVNLGTHLLISNIGDSRIYRVREGQLTQLSHDDSWVQMLIDQGLIHPSEAAYHPMRNTLLHSISGNPHDADTASIFLTDLQEKDRLIVASDGLTSYLDAQRLKSLLVSDYEINEIVNRLIQQVWVTTKDNISVVIGEFGSGSETLPQAGTYIGAAHTLHDQIAQAG